LPILDGETKSMSAESFLLAFIAAFGLFGVLTFQAASTAERTQ